MLHPWKDPLTWVPPVEYYMKYSARNDPGNGFVYIIT